MKPLDVFQLILLAALWGASFLFMRVAAPEFTPIPLIALRVAIAAIVLSVFVALRGGFAPIRKNFGALTFVGAANSAIPFSLFAFATLSLTAGFSSVLNATVPLFGAVIAFVWLRQRLEHAKIVGLFVGFAGVVILVWHKLSFEAEGLAIAAGITASILYAIVGYYTKHRLSGVDPLAISAGSQIASTLLLAIPAIVLWPEQTPTSRAWGAALALGVACTALAYVLYFRLLASVGPAKAMIVTYLIPAFGIVWGAIFLGEPVTLDMLAGGAVILVGTTVVARSGATPKPMPRPRPQPAPSLTTSR